MNLIARSQPISRVLLRDGHLSWQPVTRLLIAITGTSEQPSGNKKSFLVPTSCTMWSLHQRYVTISVSELLPHFSTLTTENHGGIFLLPFSLGYPSLTLSSTIALWCSDFPHMRGTHAQPPSQLCARVVYQIQHLLSISKTKPQQTQLFIFNCASTKQKSKSNA